tara:strand:- start:399 stop:542 length:144 start_codon:yes stop_codon:yes gene_type:complete
MAINEVSNLGKNNKMNENMARVEQLTARMMAILKQGGRTQSGLSAPN